MLTPLETSRIALMLVVLVFGMGTTLTWGRFREVARRPKAFLIGDASQFGWMPLLAFLRATIARRLLDGRAEAQVPSPSEAPF